MIIRKTVKNGKVYFSLGLCMCVLTVYGAGKLKLNSSADYASIGKQFREINSKSVLEKGTIQ
jgi:hypothetical protein